MTRVAVLGPSGRMGSRLAALIEPRSDFELSAAIDRADSPIMGQIIAGATVTSDLAQGLRECDIYIDFTTPAVTRAAAEAAASARVAAVIGTTGLDPDSEAAIDALAKVAPVMVAANFSLGVNLLLALAESAARALGDDFDFEVVEMHHNRKRDAPSGTALALARALANGRDQAFDEVLCTARSGDVGARPPGEIGVATVRGGDIVGEHTAYLIGPYERIELSHRAGSRDLFAEGALRAAAWLKGRAPGRYDMRDVLGL